MKSLAHITSFVAVALFGYAAGALALAVYAPQPAPLATPEPEQIAAAPVRAGLELNGYWPAVFGVHAPPAPASAPVVEAPAEENNFYRLTGLVAGDPDGWAMMSDDGFEKVVRRGDTLSGGETVVGIDASGVWLELDGARQLVPVQRNDLSHLAKIVQATPQQAEPPETLAEVSVPLSRTDRRAIEDAIAQAGRLTESKLADGSSGLDVVWIRRGELYDKIGLKTGDTILRINGKSVQTQNILADTPDADLARGSIDLEIIRNGARQLIKVTLASG